MGYGLARALRVVFGCDVAIKKRNALHSDDAFLFCLLDTFLSDFVFY